ncbi:Peptide methionine sulfoxide reductase MsrA [Candidatus Nitrospira nitrosa]|uniref:Peptide methionine sulfoxide reductase MsrA n=1 Tax=Candidatus Nitrospira nitrosa TaxID=1742972 RepID=A0A0S4L9A5_9BACT|nr:peptide-methionine (S)-S-oxide reductase MsrA [Candidatus Nitrospira nitrosa]CUS33406.1 Peptide methionine sulfoxide reductase MsrA [Candidatus Nitrospira nitrosa]
MTTQRRFIALAIGIIVCTLLAQVPLAEAPGASPSAKAYFAGGCFWCMEEAFEKVEGVVSVVSGYMGGTAANPTYEEVSAGRTGHAESVEVIYDPTKVTYQKLLDAFWHNVDPLTPNAQFCDHGTQYRSAVFYSNEEEKRQAEESKSAIEQARKFPAPIVTQLVPAATFYSAEDYHQDYYKKNPLRYKYYKYGCGRANRLEALWGKP